MSDALHSDLFETRILDAAMRAVSFPLSGTSQDAKAVRCRQLIAAVDPVIVERERLRHDQRVTELLAANNAEVARRRVAEGEVGRLRAIIRVNGLRAGATHAEIDAMLGGPA
jgi:hypothetical protein